MKFDSIMFNLKKNVLQYLIGFSLYLIAYGSFKPIKLILGLTSFLITYTAVYHYNDLMDYEKDKKDEWNKHYKALVRGDLSKKNAITLSFVLPIIGLLIASFVSQWYMIILIFLLFQNFLHSAPQTTKIFKDKKRFMFVNMYLMQAIKFILGWLTFTTDLTRLPIWIINTLSLWYLWSYYVLKKGLKNITQALKSNLKTSILLTSIATTSYLISFLLYPYKLVSLLVPVFCLLFLTQSRNNNLTSKTIKLTNLTLVVLGSIFIMLLLLNVPVIAQLNHNTSRIINEFILNETDNDGFINTLNKTMANSPIKNLDELNELFNPNEKEIII